MLQTNIQFDEDHGHNEILNRAMFPEGHHIDARMSSRSSLFTQHTDFRPTTHHDAFCSESM